MGCYKSPWHPSTRTTPAPWTSTAGPTIPLGLTNPLAKTVWRTAQFACDRSMRCCVASIFVTMLRDKANRALAELR